MNDSFDLPRNRVLIVDDDAELRALVSETLDRHGFVALEAGSVAEAEILLARYPIDLIILDIMMPHEDGLSFCKRLSHGPGPLILMMSALGGSADRIVGLEMGADGYLSKPCEPRELIAHVKAVLRRLPKHGSTTSEMVSVIEFAGWQLDLIGRYLRNPDGVVIDLSTSEFRLLRVMAERPKMVLTRDQLLEATRAHDFESYDRAIDIQISRLRRKLGQDGTRLIATVRNEGYQFAAAVVRR